MKRISMYLSMLAIAVVLLSSCKKDDDPVNPVDNPKPGPVKNLIATSDSSDAIFLKWDASDSSASTLFEGYIVTPTKPSVLPPRSMTKEITSCKYDGLQPGIAYTIEVVAKYSNGEISTPVTITWATADRFTTDNNGDVIKLYSSKVSGQGSGIDIYDATAKKPIVLTTTNFQKWCLGFEDKTAGYLRFGHPDSLDYKYLTSREVDILAMGDATSDNLRDFVVDKYDTFTYERKAYNLYGKTKTQAYIVRVKNSEGKYNYAKVLVLYKNGSFVQTDGIGDYIEIVISYQATADLPYAK